MNRRLVGALVLALASCGVRAPGRIDVDGLVRVRGEVEARRDLEIRVIADPKDVQARLALAALAERTGRPSAAIEQLEKVDALGGPLGTRWHGDDRARLARLLAARGRIRLARGAASALADLERAAELGAPIDHAELRSARALDALGKLAHVDRELNAAGKRTLAALVADPKGCRTTVASSRVAVDAGAAERIAPCTHASWRGAATRATAAERGAFGVWLWQRGARRAAWEELSAWRAATTVREPDIAAAYVAAYAWWTPPDAPGPDTPSLTGPDRCRFPDASGCDASLLVREPIDRDAIAARWLARPADRTKQPDEAAAWLQLTLRQALRGEVAWGPALAARVDVAAVPVTALPPPLRATYARLVGRVAPETEPDAGATALERVTAAAGRVLRGASATEVRRVLGPAADTGEGRALLATVEPRGDAGLGREVPFVAAAVAYVRARVPDGPDAGQLRVLVRGYRRDPAIADRLAREAVERAPDAAVAHAATGALFDALGDPARARLAWQAAVDGSPELAHLRGLAEAIARADDPDAALIAATTAAAASGDPAPVWLEVARALVGTGEYQHGLEAARYAIELGSAEPLAEALAVAASASAALGRASQVAALEARRARVIAVPVATDDPTDAAAALAAYRRHPTAAAVARMWVASRWNARDVAIRAALVDATAPDDPRRAALATELVALAADRDPDRARAAVRALR